MYGWRALEELVALDVLEILVGGDLQFVGGFLVADDDAVLVHLEGRDGPHVVDGSLDGGLHGAGLGVAVDQDHHFAGVHHGAYAYGEGVCRHVLRIAAEETAVGNAGVGGEGLHAGTAAERRARLVEGDVAVGADASDEEVDAACLLDHLLIVLALGLQVGGVAVEDVDVLFRAVDVVEQVTGHEGVVTLRVGLGQADILIHIEGEHVLERYFTSAAGLDEGIVHAYGRRTGGQAEHEFVVGCRLELIDTLDDVVCGPL